MTFVHGTSRRAMRHTATALRSALLGLSIATVVMGACAAPEPQSVNCDEGATKCHNIVSQVTCVAGVWGAPRRCDSQMNGMIVDRLSLLKLSRSNLSIFSSAFRSDKLYLYLFFLQFRSIDRFQKPVKICYRSLMT